MSDSYREVDVRPILRDGGEPFQAIMDAVHSLAPGEGLRLLATFKPAPLLTVMTKRGFSYEVRELEGGDCEVLFSPIEGGATRVSVSVGAEDAFDWPEPLWQLDLTGLEPPEPMSKVLSRIELMEPGEVLFAVFDREPVFLMPEIEKRGHRWVGSFDGGGKVFRMLIRIGAEQ